MQMLAMTSHLRQLALAVRTTVGLIIFHSDRTWANTLKTPASGLGTDPDPGRKLCRFCLTAVKDQQKHNSSEGWYQQTGNQSVQHVSPLTITWK